MNQTIMRTPLYEQHKKSNARFVEFGGWEMPVMYSSIIDEHNAVRNNCGLFDASHMGEFIVSGKMASDFLNRMTVANVPDIKPYQAKYSLFLNENGGIIDDLIIYRRENDFMLIVNAGNIEKDFNWLKKNIFKNVTLENISENTALLALQGPLSEKILQPMINEDLKGLKSFNFMIPAFKSYKPDFAVISRTGYTGEDGFEILVSNCEAPMIWQELVSNGAKPCGLGARDSLRLEAAMSLHGHEINDETTPLEATLGWTIYWEKEFIGKKALLKLIEKGLIRFLTAFILENGIAREGADIMMNSTKIGRVTSGSFSPTLKKGICLGYVNQKLEPNTIVEIIVHHQPKKAAVVKKPFYKRKNSGQV
ncbi:MAG: glycine cleavage system aminomethyltransferase GcvT [Elusimicrobia bacterium]|nr:glycine cleavage system aminomethyltransferase GcvT [Candidatus Liberimonas magnetica]